MRNSWKPSGGADLRVLAVEFEHARDLRGESIDVILSGGLPPQEEDQRFRLWREEVVPVAHPDFWRHHGMPDYPDALRDLPLLELSKRNFGWLDWWGWFDDRLGTPSPPPEESYSNDVYLLEAPAAGQGGWDSRATSPTI
jgi:DNA-binding transcriptional LysR family regulator